MGRRDFPGYSVTSSYEYVRMQQNDYARAISVRIDTAFYKALSAAGMDGGTYTAEALIETLESYIKPTQPI